MVGKVFRAVGLIKTPKKEALPAPLPTPTRDTARDQLTLIRELRKRRGGAADILTGSGGAEAGKTGKTQLG